MSGLVEVPPDRIDPGTLPEWSGNSSPVAGAELMIPATAWTQGLTGHQAA